MDMMKPQKMFETLMDFQKTMMNNSASMMAMSYDRSDNMTSMFLDHAFWMSEKWKTAIMNWQDACQEGCQILAQTIHDRFNTMNQDFMQQWPGMTAKAAKDDCAE